MIYTEKIHYEIYEIKHDNINQMNIRMRRYETNMILKIKIKIKIKIKMKMKIKKLWLIKIKTNFNFFHVTNRINLNGAKKIKITKCTLFSVLTCV